MQEITVGIRELKTHLSKYLHQVKAGQILVITEHGKPIGRVIPTERSIASRMQALLNAGLLEWSGRRLAPMEPVVSNQSDKLMSEIISEMR